ncbi:hypothetical protein [Bradyrhizobium sp. 195]|uniref:hypothetical protein n=1 Tax=Bradyrhizobium sp. 195 TaxID=2782662 RepID=UPI002000814B|nr:hypothetical protein [Bradyrhizobium sp. 195]UPK31105.1 hypothetical protein IVB26_38730 [Bradyrhizobium sp. 195]
MLMHLPTGDDGAHEADDCRTVEEHEAGPVIGPALLEHPAPGSLLGVLPKSLPPEAQVDRKSKAEI